ncbi:Putative DNA repair protein Rad4 [Septoria linicola]|uniref:DNA repair protein Rad4 n=1 Tax=Septoria linicola TaxID=215465 RepID=A0A9Q9AJN9_9PEZI|nr:Putative DNA repair protein Rad4 [Septoria linicola]
MAPSRGKGKAAVLSRAQPARRSTRGRAIVHDAVPDVYSAMLTDVRSEEGSGDDRPLKKRRVTPRKPVLHKRSAEELPDSTLPLPAKSLQSDEALGPTKERQQTVEDSSESEADDFEFEDVDLDLSLESAAEVDGIEDLSISVQPQHDAPRNVSQRRKPATTIEKSHRLLVHKLHVLCLLGHCMYVNGRCNNTSAQRHLRPLLTGKTVSYLNPSKHDTQFQRNRSFLDGLQQALDAFVPDYKIIASGLTRPKWNIDEEPKHSLGIDAEPIGSVEFIGAAKNLEGSQDMASQLFCAMLRSAGVEARIVCSLQSLPFTSVPKGATPKKPAKVRIMAIAPDTDVSGTRRPQDDISVRGSRAIGNVPSARRRLGQPSFVEETIHTTPAQKKPKAVVKLSFPVFWVEAFNEANQKWVAIDPVVTNTVNKPSKLEPPASYELNQLSYAIAFEDDGSARDVTRRYAKAYNAKTRRHRVEASEDGAKWWKKAMRVFRRKDGLLDRDQVEDAEMAQKEAREGLPANVLDFKDHPYYALERHLKRQEVIHPRRDVGKVNAGTAAKPKMEPVFRRRDVLACRSADKWYRNGRELKANEQPLKHVPARARRQTSPGDQSSVTAPAPTTALYAPFQTQLYVPPPVQRGRVPRNSYGNLDVFVPTMVPAGGVHIRHPSTPQAAKLLRIDYADAVIGFHFKGRHGTAVIEGAVVASQYADAIREVIDGLEYMTLEDEARARSLLALKMWKRFLVGLRIAERVRAYGISPSAPTNEGMQEAQDTLISPGADKELVTAGRFSLRELERRRPAARKRKVAESDTEEEILSRAGEYSDQEAGGFVLGSGGAEPNDQPFNADTSSLYQGSPDGSRRNATHVDEIAENQGGGFFVDDAEPSDNGGGFVVDDAGVSGNQGGGFITEGINDTDGPDDYTSEMSIDNFPGGEQKVMHTPAERSAEPAAHQSTATVARHETRSGPEPGAPGDKLPDEFAQKAMPVDRYSENEMESIPERPFQPAVQSGHRSPSESEHGEESDRGSMLSHDPEDDEAEPDWLESD